MNIYLLSEFISTTPGEPYRLFPFGTIYKDGQPITITPELAHKFKLPHFKPPIKLGSHVDTTPAGGHIVGLEVRDDGLYAIPSLNPAGTTAVSAGAYRYHSPEVIWEGGALEDPATGNLIEGPIIVGDALLHTPHLGEVAALYTVLPIPNGGNMSEQTINVPTSWFESFMNRLGGQPAPSGDSDEPPQVQIPEEFSTQITSLQAQLTEQNKQIAEYQTQITAMEAKNARNGRVAQFSATFQETAVSDDTELFELLADLDDEAAVKFSTKLKALAEQVRVSNLTDDVGDSGGGEGGADALAKFEAAVRKHMAENNVNYNAAVNAVALAQPELAKEAQGD